MDIAACGTGRWGAPGDPDFDDRRRVWNAGIDRRPSLIARRASAADVVEAIGLASQHQLEVSVRGGAHNIAGTAVCDDGLMIDLSQLNASGRRRGLAGRRAHGVPPGYRYEAVVPSAAAICRTASASAGLTSCPSSRCAAATWSARARTKCW